MPDLPTITVTQAQADRMIAVFGSAAGYREWLRRNIVAAVMADESQKIERASNADREQKLQTLADSMPKPPAAAQARGAQQPEDEVVTPPVPVPNALPDIPKKKAKRK